MKFLKLKTNDYNNNYYINVNQIVKIKILYDPQLSGVKYVGVYKVVFYSIEEDDRIDNKLGWLNFETQEEAENCIEHLDWYCVPKMVEKYEVNRG